MIKLYKTVPISFPRSAAKPYQIHLQHHLLTWIAYTIIAKHKQIGSTQGTPASRPLRYPRSLVDHAHHNLSLIHI
ncbi:hypothetical protein DEO72_LG1g2407 [Vigna unguiculata]|uniref:Uncharacterized protein n=1 Tax=Vigna unguiculata TaxID=3917 RepID=A0A4D6KWC4_VIGUN|nr:hypothetical protein DEO72_LG1g2407 [Vigna unguiculata]